MFKARENMKIQDYEPIPEEELEENITYYSLLLRNVGKCRSDEEFVKNVYYSLKPYRNYMDIDLKERRISEDIGNLMHSLEEGYVPLKELDKLMWNYVIGTSKNKSNSSVETSSRNYLERDHQFSRFRKRREEKLRKGLLEDLSVDLYQILEMKEDSEFLST